MVFKQEGLDQRIQYDDLPRKSLVDLFYDDDVSLEAVAAGQAAQHGDFVDGDYEARVRRNPERIQVQLTREGNGQRRAAARSPRGSRSTPAARRWRSPTCWRICRRTARFTSPSS